MWGKYMDGITVEYAGSFRFTNWADFIVDDFWMIGQE
jgi:hypothetical protein